MYQFQLTTDSGCDLPMSLCKERGIIPLQRRYEIVGVTYLENNVRQGEKACTACV